MNRKLAAIPAALVIAAAPAFAFASPGSNSHAQSKAYGKFCQAESKKHVAGQKGTPFSQCVTAMAKLAHNDKMSAKQACKSESKKHVKGQKGTPYSQCIKAAAQLRKSQPTPTPTPTATATETSTATSSS